MVLQADPVQKQPIVAWEPLPADFILPDDPYEPSLEVRCLQDGKYVLQQADNNGRLWIPELELFLGVWQGERLCQPMNWLRWWDSDGNLLLWSSEQTEQERQRAEQERQRAETLAAKLRELGVDPDTLG
jgi:hypothetical protein